jgi:hypothetical protein
MAIESSLISRFAHSPRSGGGEMQFGCIESAKNIVTEK